MPLKLITGLPGNGKTAFMIDHLFKLELAGVKRKIYIVGIELFKEFKLDIEPLDYDDVKQWQDKEHGALWIIDEAQKIMPQRGSSATCPKFITDLSTHRHLGLDFIFLTQDPKLLDVWARRNIAEHQHIKRLFGSTWQVVFKWDKCVDQPRERKEQSSATKNVTRIPKRVFGAYQSAVEHTIKTSVPLAVKIGGLLIVSLPFLVWWVFATFDLGADTIAAIEEKSTSAPALSVQSVSAPPQTKLNYVGDYKDFIERDLRFVDAMRYGDKLIIVIIMTDPVTKSRLRLGIEDLQYESGLQYSLVGNNKLLLKQGDRKRVLYRSPEPETFQADDNPTIQDALNQSAENTTGLLNVPF